MKLALFVVFLGIFTCTEFVTLLGITGHLVIDREYLEPLFTSLILESIGSIILLFKATKFFDEQQQKSAASVSMPQDTGGALERLMTP